MLLLLLPILCLARRSEVIGPAIKKPVNILSLQSVPTEFNWCANGYCTSSRNQHIPVYCGACWDFAATSALADRLKYIRKAAYPDIMLSTQHVLNCISGASCYGGQIDSVYDWLLDLSKSGGGLSYEDAQPYLACSSDSTEGYCKSIDTTCKSVNIARTCGSFESENGPCVGLKTYPNITISDYGTISGKSAMKTEISTNGPIACGIDAMPLLNYKGGIVKDSGTQIDHVVEVVGWSDSGGYWIIRNSWGNYWGEFSFARISYGSLLLEQECAWATILDYTAPEKNNLHPCTEGGQC